MKPMLAAATNGENLNYPLLASVKLDGIRCLVIDGVAVGRSLKPIPNKHVQKLFGHSELNGLDGELIVGEPWAANVFSATSSGVMSIDGEPSVRFFVFDDFTKQIEFHRRLRSASLRSRSLTCVIPVSHVIISNELDLAKYEESSLAEGFEGVMLRCPNGPYKYGRSTAKESLLLKLKRFTDGEAMIIAFHELMHNTNEAKTNELGHKERSSKKAGLVGRGCLGAITVEDVKTGVIFDIGTGFTQVDREMFWAMRKSLAGKIVKYKSQPVGVKDKPRFPVFIGLRHPIDM